MKVPAHPPCVLLEALRAPQALAAWPLERWDVLVRQARGASLIGRLAAVLEDLGLMARVPAAPRAHLEAAAVMASAQEEEIRREVAHLRKALAAPALDVVLLKGAAYVLAGLHAGRGRFMSDIDIMVPGEALARVEAALLMHGWAGSHHDAYDQRYYRRWMHELPPMRHVKRQTVLDVHHAIVPRTARLKPEAAKLLAASQPLPHEPRVRVLAPPDLVLHSATHLFLNEELTSGLRDLVDLDSLLRELGRRPGFWEALLARSQELDLARPLYYALRYAKRLLDAPVPEAVLRASERTGPPTLLRALMDTLFLRALQPAHPSAADFLTPLARTSLYVRAHWLRMPPALLALHLTVKAFRRPQHSAG